MKDLSLKPKIKKLMMAWSQSFLRLLSNHLHIIFFILVFSVSQVSSASTTTGSNSNDLDYLATYLFGMSSVIGGLVLFWGAVQLALSYTNDQASSRIKGFQLILAGGALMSLGILLNNMGIFNRVATGTSTSVGLQYPALDNLVEIFKLVREFVLYLGYGVVFFGTMQLGVSMGRDAADRAKAIRFIVGGCMIIAVAMSVNTFVKIGYGTNAPSINLSNESYSAGTSIVRDIMYDVASWMKLLGLAYAFFGLVQAVVAFKNESPDDRMKGIKIFAGGLMIFASASLPDVFQFTNGSNSFFLNDTAAELYKKLLVTAAQWLQYLGLALAFFGMIQIGSAYKNDDASAKTKGVQSAIAGFMLYAVSQIGVLSNFYGNFVGGGADLTSVVTLGASTAGDGYNRFAAMMATLAKGSEYLGYIIAFFGVVQFAFSFKNDDASDKLKGMRALMSGFIIIAVSKSVAYFIVSATTPIAADYSRLWQVIGMLVEWTKTLALASAFFGAIQLAASFKSEDPEKKNAGLKTMIAGFIVFAVCGSAAYIMNLNAGALGGIDLTGTAGTESLRKLNSVIDAMAKWLVSIGLIGSFFSFVQLASAFKSEDASGKLSGLRSLVSCFLLMVVGGAVNLFLIDTVDPNATFATTDTRLNDIIITMAAWVKNLGLTFAFFGAAQLAFSYRSEEAEPKMKGLNSVIAGLLMFAVGGSVGFFGIAAGNVLTGLDISQRFNTLVYEMARWIGYIGVAATFFGAMQMSIGYRSDDAAERAKGLRAIVSGLMATAISLSVTFFMTSTGRHPSVFSTAAGGEKLYSIMLLIAEWTKYSSLAYCFFAVIQLAMGFKGYDADSKSKGIRALTSSLLLFGFASAADFFLTQNGLTNPGTNVATTFTGFEMGIKNFNTIFETLVEWSKYIGLASAFFGTVQIGHALRSEDPDDKVKGIYNVVAGLIVFAVSFAVSFFQGDIALNNGTLAGMSEGYIRFNRFFKFILSCLGYIGLATVFFASLQLGMGFRTDDAEAKNRGIRSLVAGLVVYALTGAVTFFTVDTALIPADEIQTVSFISKYGSILKLIIIWVEYLGLAMAFFGAIQLGYGYKSEDADDKNKGLRSVIAGLIVYTIAGAGNFFITDVMSSADILSVNNSTSIYSTVMGFVARWAQYLGMAMSFFGALQAALSLKSFDAGGKIKGINAVVAGLIVFTVSSGISFFVGGAAPVDNLVGIGVSPGIARLKLIMSLIAKWTQYVGFVSSFFGCIQMGIAFRDDDSKSKSSAVSIIATGFAIFAIASAVGYFMTII